MQFPGNRVHVEPLISKISGLYREVLLLFLLDLHRVNYFSAPQNWPKRQSADLLTRKFFQEKFTLIVTFANTVFWMASQITRPFLQECWVQLWLVILKFLSIVIGGESLKYSQPVSYFIVYVGDAIVDEGNLDSHREFS